MKYRQLKLSGYTGKGYEYLTNRDYKTTNDVRRVRLKRDTIKEVENIDYSHLLYDSSRDIVNSIRSTSERKALI